MWRRCRAGDDATRYGLPGSAGWHELQGSVVCDIAAVAKDEHFEYAHWPLAQPPPPSREEQAWLDEAADAVERENFPTILNAAKTGFVRLAASHR